MNQFKQKIFLAGCKVSTSDSSGGSSVQKGKQTAVVIPKGRTVRIVGSDSSWNEFLAEDDDDSYRGVFIEGRNVTLSAFALSKHEVTQELFEDVMGVNPSICNSNDDNYKNMLAGEEQKYRPVDNVNWYQAVAFCNKLSLKDGLEPCYSVKTGGVEIDWANLAFSDIPTAQNTDWDNISWDTTKKGWRLPTEAEWEFAARGGDPSSADWKFSYAGVTSEDTYKTTGKKIPFLDSDEALDGYGWYLYNLGGTTDLPELRKKDAGYGSHEVGMKRPNALGLYDMSGNIYEWCWDRASSTLELGELDNPKGPETGGARVIRGGSWKCEACFAVISSLGADDPLCENSYWVYDDYGFRLCRSL